MNIKINRSDLLQALAAADGVARAGSTMPLLECVLIAATGADKVTISATDAAMTMRAEIASTNRKEGETAINAKRLRDVVKGAPDESISIVALDNGWIEVKSGKAVYKLAALHAREFPKMPEPASPAIATFDGDALRSLIDRVLFSISDDKTRMHMNGALLEVRAGVASMTSTDGHRLTRATWASDAKPFKVTIPKESLAKLSKLAIGSVDLFVDRSRLFARTAAVTFSTPLVDGDFPPVDKVIPASHNQMITINRTALIASIERTKIATNDLHGTNIDSRAGSLMLSSSHPDVGDVSDEIEAEGATRKVSTCVAPKYLLEPLARMTDEVVTLKLGAELDPVVIESATAGAYLAVLMPMRRS
jgi:DNA polymerase-3 subunit beta